VGEVKGGGEPICDVAVPRAPGDLVGIKTTHQLGLPGPQLVYLAFTVDQFVFPMVDLIRFGIPLEHMFIVTPGCDKFALEREENERNPRNQGSDIHPG
jgi:hypothetical protein